ncbi:defective proboscis extension response 10 isoform X2 [Musca autumnalis]|uniref:defective proboscis extension response 10 isoform X2 n=1 Tax=Musca autumnalis TaxID=221902 RepID=UPI003CEB1977
MGQLRLSMCYQRLSGNPNHNNVDQKPTHLPPGHYSHGHRWNEPYFDVTMPKNITSLVGKSAYLGCRVKHLGNKTVAWIRHRDLHILTVGTYTYTTDQRFQTSYHRDIDEWTLQIKWAQQRDAGVYECQISTQPVRSFSVHLNIVDTLDSEQNDMMQQFYNDESFIITNDRVYQSGDDEFAGMFGPLQTVAVPTATILGGPDLYVDKGSTINLTCVIKFSTEPPTHIFWYHQDKVLSEETSGGRLKFKTIKSEETKSILLIDDANISDSGKYSCYPSNTEIASIRVHVLQGERPEAMQTNAAASPKVRTSNQFAIILTAFGMTFALLRMLATLCHIFIANCHRIRSDSSNGSITTIKAKSKCRSKSNRNSIYTRNDNCDTAHVDASDETAYSDDNINDFEKCNAVDCYKKRTSDTLWNSTVNGSLPQKKEIQKDIFSYTLPIKWSERHDLR